MRISDWSSDVCSSDLNEKRLSLGLNWMSVRFSGRTDSRVNLPSASCVSSPSVTSNGCFSPLPRSHSIFTRTRPAQTQRAFIGQRLSSTTSTGWTRSEEHTSELQSLLRISYAVFCLKKKTHKTQ